MSYQADLIGIDLETGGLNTYVTTSNGERVHGAKYFPVLEMAIVLPQVNADGTLSVESGRKLVVGIRHSKDRLARLDDYVTKMHTKSGLFDRLETGEGFDYVAANNAMAEQYIIETLKEWGVRQFDRKEGTGAILYGNNINFDFSFIDDQMPDLAAFFHYRKVDVSAINVLSRSLWAGLGFPEMKKVLAHTALSDITESSEELNLYTNYLIEWVD